MVVDLPAPFGPIKPTSSPASSEKLTRSSASTVRMRRWNRPLSAPNGAGVALGDAIGLGQLANEDLRHGRGLRGLGKGRAGGRGPYRRHICRATADAGQRAGTFSGVAKLQPTAIAAT